MNWLDVPIHLQDDHTRCGPACAQMVSRFLELDVKPVVRPVIRDQSEFTAGPGTPDFTTNPAQLARMINNTLRSGVPRYRDYATETATEALGIAAASVQARYPAVMLVDEGDHWEVLIGYTSLGVHVRNPAPDRTLLAKGRPLQPHRDDDDGCATHLDSFSKTAAGDELYTVAGWLRRTDKPCSREDPLWFGKYVVVAREQVTAVSPLTWSQPKQPSQAKLQVSEIPRLALEALYQSDLIVQRPQWRDFDVRASQPRHLLVETDRGAPYYLVDIRNQGRSVLIGLDAATGDLLWARLNPTLRTLKQLERAMSNRARWTRRVELGHSPFLPDVETEDRPEK